MFVGVDVEQVGASALPCGRPFFCFLHLLRSLFSSTYNLLVDSKFWITLQSLLSCAVFRVSVTEVYGSLCRMLQTGPQ